jgi:hypothetical protein
MTTRFWVKLYIEILDDPKMGRLSNHLWRRAVEFILLAGKQDGDGALPPVEEMAWTLRLSEDKVLEDLHGLAEVGVVHEAEPGAWFVTNFKERQTSESYDRVKRYRERYSNAQCNGQSNGEVAAGSSTSTSDSVSLEEEGVQGEEEPRALPVSPVEAMLHPDVRVFAAVTGGRIPGLSQYRSVIDAVRFLRAREKVDDARLGVYLAPYWLAWSSRKRQDGRPYDPGNISWLTEWALNGSIPPPGGSRATEPERVPVPSLEETRRMLAERDEKLKNTVPPPKDVRAKIRSPTGQFAVKDTP